VNPELRPDLVSKVPLVRVVDQPGVVAKKAKRRLSLTCEMYLILISFPERLRGRNDAMASPERLTSLVVIALPLLRVDGLGHLQHLVIEFGERGDEHDRRKIKDPEFSAEPSPNAERGVGILSRFRSHLLTAIIPPFPFSTTVWMIRRSWCSSPWGWRRPG